MIEEGEYGIVVELGRRGEAIRTGYYDDDDDGQRGIVYFDRPFIDGYFLISRKRLRAATEAERKEWMLKHYDDLPEETKRVADARF